MPIDRFLRSLADDCGSRAIGVILSGAGSDGSAGLEAIKAAGGVTFAQELSTAKFSSMPQAAAATGCVDFVLPPEGIAAELVRIGRHPYLADGRAIGEEPAAEEAPFGIILTTLHGSPASTFRSTGRRRSSAASCDGWRCAISTASKIIPSISKRIPVELTALQRDLLIKRDQLLSRSRIVRLPEEARLPSHSPREAGQRDDSHLGGGLRYGRRGLLDRHIVVGIPERNRRRLPGADLRFRYQLAGHRKGPHRQVPREHLGGSDPGAAESVLYENRRRLPDQQGPARDVCL